MKDYTAILTQQVHSNPSFEKYEETSVRNNTNCYSHALGATYPKLELYRVGAISQKKPIEEIYFSVEEIKELLFSDFETLNLKIEESSMEEELLDNQYKIALFVKIYNGQIADYHFWRFENSLWTEKWKGRGMNEIQNFERDKLNYFPWNFVGIYKVTR